MKKVGIYSGTFDPIHIGHLAFAKQAVELCGLDKLFFLVEPRPRRKQGVKAFEHRAQMVHLAIADNPKLGSIILEHQRFTAVDTLPKLTSRFKGAELYMLMGDDWLSHFAAWPHVEKLTQKVRFIIGVRKYDETEIDRRLKILQSTKGLGLQYQLLKVNLPEFSSSAIRRQLKKHQTPSGIEPVVLEYIRNNGLYVPASSSGEGSDTYS